MVNQRWEFVKIFINKFRKEIIFKSQKNAKRTLNQVEVVNLENFLTAAKDLEIKGLQVASNDQFPK